MVDPRGNTAHRDLTGHKDPMDLKDRTGDLQDITADPLIKVPLEDRQACRPEW